MKKIALLILMAALCLGGCTNTVRIENQAYAISMSIDLLDNAIYEIGVQIPTIGADTSSSSKSGNGGGGANSQYRIASARGASYAEAFNLLQASIPRTLNVSRLRSIVFSRAIAESDHFGVIIESIMQTYNFYSASGVIVCEDEALAFIENQKPFIGVRLSVTVRAMMEHYYENGYVPKVLLADLYNGMRSLYSDPVAILAANQEAEPLDELPPGEMGEAYPGTLPREGDNVNEYMGCALFKRSKMVGTLDGAETQVLNIIRGATPVIGYMSSGLAVRLTCMGKAKIHVDLSKEIPEITINIKFGVVPLTSMPSLNDLAREYQKKVENVIRKCQKLGVEPFNFSEHAASSFLTYDSWKQYDWPDRFSKANIQVHVEMEALSE